LRRSRKDEGERILRRMQSYNERLADPKRLREDYLHACAKHGRRFALGLFYEFRKKGPLAAWRFFQLHLATDMHRSWIRGLFSLGKM
jgi:hypothetical protein